MKPVSRHLHLLATPEGCAAERTVSGRFSGRKGKGEAVIRQFGNQTFLACGKAGKKSPPGPELPRNEGIAAATFFRAACPARDGSFVTISDIYSITSKTICMEKFMLIFQGPVPPPKTPDQMQAEMEEWMSWIDKLAKEDRYVSGEPLLPGGKLIKGSLSNVTDGPYTEGKELVGGFFIIKAADYDEAVRLCSDYPGFDSGGSIQVRQVMKMDM